jgi:nucleotide-binding universal stress UspA family protein
MVIGTHGRTGVSRAVWGSVAEALLELAPCDVLVARAG